MLTACNATAEQLENMLHVEEYIILGHDGALELIRLIRATLKAVWYSAKCFDSFIIGKTKLLTWPTQAVTASKYLRKPWHKNCTVQFDHCDSAPTASLLLLQHSQVHRDSQSTGAGGKEPVCSKEKCYFTGIKCRHVFCTVMKIELCVLWMHIVFPQHRPDNTMNWTYHSVGKLP